MSRKGRTNIGYVQTTNAQFGHEKETKAGDKNHMVETEDDWITSDFKIFSVIFIIRLCAALTTSISDCDETFNYWEPTHFWLFGKGHQTWEYDPKFALRSYLYLIIHGLPGYLCSLVFNINRVFMFYLIKSILALLCSLCEIYFYKGVSRVAGANVGLTALLFSTFSAGMFISSTAFLPSSTSMLLLMLSHGAWFRKSYGIAIFTTALSTFLSWPFAALLGLPIALDIILRQGKVSLTWNLLLDIVEVIFTRTIIYVV